MTAMQNGEPVIYQGVLRDAESRTYGAPDLLVRSDELQRLFPGVLAEEEARRFFAGAGLLALALSGRGYQVHHP